MAQPTDPLSGILAEMTIDDVRVFAPEVAVLSLGSTEPHGPHLPYGTDSYEVEGLCTRAVRQANAQGGRALLLPTFDITNNVNFKAFPFACRIGVLTLMNVLLDVIQSLEEDGIRKIVIVNGHGGNPETIRATLREHVNRTPASRRAFVCTAHAGAFLPPETVRMIEHPSDHAGENETSRMLYLRPDLVRSDNFQDFPVQKPVLEQLTTGKVFFIRPWHGYLPTSAGGETRTSSPDKGRALIEDDAKGLARFLVDLTHVQMGALFPYPDHDKAPANSPH